MKPLSGLSFALLAWAGAAAGDPATAADPACCQSLSRHLPSIYHGPSSPEYRRLVAARWSGTSVLRPACVVAPASAGDVAAAVRLLAAGRCRFAVKSGGHNANPGANSIDGGVSVDLGRLDGVALAPDRSHVRLGAGATWGRAYDAFNRTNVAFPGGVCGGVGVGGLALGGGQSVFQASRGWVVDNILNYELVLASGRVVNVSQRSRPDLFRALKGGSTNFGIVTRVDIAAFEFNGLWIGADVVSLDGPGASRPAMLDRISRAMVDFIAANDRELETEVQLVISYLSGNKGQLVDFGFTNTGNFENPPAIRGFKALPNRVASESSHTNMAGYARHINTLFPDGFRQGNAGMTITNDYKTIRQLWDAYDEIYNALPQRDKVDWSIQLVPQPKIQQSYARARGGNSLGLADVKEDQMVIWFVPRWTDASLDGMMRAAQQRFVDVTAAIAKRHGTYSPWIYVSYASPTQDPLCGYGPESVAFLKRTARKYDPGAVFQDLMPGGFKVSRANCARS